MQRLHFTFESEAAFENDQVETEIAFTFLSFWALASFWFKALPPVRLTWRQRLPWSVLVAALHGLGRMIVA